MSTQAEQRIAECLANQATRLDLSRCGLKTLPLALSACTHLKELYLFDNQIQDIQPIKELKQLTLLYLNSNQIQDIQPIKELKQLVKLYLNNNQIQGIQPIKELKQLTKLDLGNNQIQNIQPIKELKQLTLLHLNNNQIQNIQPIKELKQLTKLELRNNQIQDIQPIKELISQGIEVNLEEPRFSNTINLGGNPLKSPPPEIVQQGNEAILNYFEQLEVQGRASLYEAKLLIVGEPGAGKTTLYHKLLDPAYELPTDKSPEALSTLGINIHEGWQFLCTQADSKAMFKANLWDFGGQEIQYMLHQFFLTPRSLYVLVADNRKQHTQFPYWFRIIHLLGKDQEQSYSPVLVVLNEIRHQSVSNFDQALYRREYPELAIESVAIDLSDQGAAIQTLTHKVQHKLSHLPHVGKAQLPAQWLKVRAALRQEAEEHSYINFARYAQICEYYQISKSADQLLLGQYLHDLGVILHFQDAQDGLHDLLILQPEWAVDAIYSILTNTEVEQNKGKFDQSFVYDIWEKQGYSFVERGYLLALMRKDIFEICYPLADQENAYITPLLLPDIAPSYDWNYPTSLRFRYQYAFMPPGILTRLIVRLSTLIVKEAHQDLVWKTGVLLQKDDCQVEVRERETLRQGEKVIDIAVVGNAQQKKYVLRLIREEIDRIHQKSFPSLKPVELVPCICAECQQAETPAYHKYEKLVKMQQKGNAHDYCDLGNEVAVQQLLEGVYDADELERKGGAQGRQAERVHVTVNNHYTPPPPAPSPTPPSPETPQKKDDQYWTLKSLAVGVVLGSIVTFIAHKYLHFPVLETALVACPTFFFAAMLRNPERRYFRVGMLLLSLLAGGLALPSISAEYVSKGTQARFAIKDSPVTSVFLMLTMLALFGFDLYLEWQRRKRQ